MLNLNFQNGTTPALNARNMNAIVESINTLGYAVGGPNVASTVSAMTDTSKVYVYTGSETGYTAGNWYYYNGSAWVSGGVYQATAVETDTTLTMPGVAADAKATGDAVTELKSAITNYTELYVEGEIVVSPHYLNKNSSGGKPTTDNNTRLISEKIYMPPDSTGSILRVTTGTSVVLCRFDSADTLIETIYASGTEKRFEHCDHITIYIQYSNNDPITPTNGLNIATLKLYYVNPLETEVDYLSDVKQTIYTKQLYDRNNVVTGKYMNVNGGVVDDSSYAYSPEIDTSNNVGDTLYFSVNGSAVGVRFVTAFDNSGNAVPGSGINDGTMTTTTYIVPNGVNSVIITFKNPSTNSGYNHFQVEWDEITPYVEKHVINRVNPDLINNIDNIASDILYGKKWAVCGDSFTDGVTNTKIQGGKYDGMNYSYPYLIGTRTGINILKFFRGGKTLANPSDGTFTNSLTNPNAPGTEYYQNIPADVDYITIYLGINDGNHDIGSGTTPDGEDATGVITLGTINDDTTATYYGAWNVVLTWLLTNRPFSHIGIIVSNGCKNSDWTEAQRLIARKYGIPYLDLNGDDRCRAMIRPQNSNIPNTIKEIIKQNQAVDPSTNTHPNDAAHLLESTFIEDFLRSL